ncbi:MAG: hypothetical protein ABW049_05710 [Spongiibacteraceae bacterium]
MRTIIEEGQPAAMIAHFPICKQVSLTLTDDKTGGNDHPHIQMRNVLDIIERAVPAELLHQFTDQPCAPSQLQTAMIRNHPPLEN